MNPALLIRSTLFLQADRTIPAVTSWEPRLAAVTHLRRKDVLRLPHRLAVKDESRRVNLAAKQPEMAMRCLCSRLITRRLPVDGGQVSYHNLPTWIHTTVWIWTWCHTSIVPSKQCPLLHAFEASVGGFFCFWIDVNRTWMMRCNWTRELRKRDCFTADCYQTILVRKLSYIEIL